MTALTSIKAALDPLFDERVFRDEVPDDVDGVAFPCATILADLSRQRVLSGDGRAMAMREQWQIDVWQQQTNEDDDLVPGVTDALEGLTVGSDRLALRIDGVNRLIDEEGLIHYAVTVQTTVLM